MIPSRAHFYWTGASLPWPYAYAVRSAAVNGGLEQVVLHHTDAITTPETWRFVRETPNVETRPLDPDALLGRVPGLGERLVDLHRRVGPPVARSNILRAAVLLLEGGVYLDLDTITVRPLGPLLLDAGFIGVEHIVRPHFVHAHGTPLQRLHSTALSVLRNGLRVLPRGYRLFRGVAPLYHQAINGAVLGARAGHPLLEQYLRAMVELPPQQQVVAHGLGTHLLQQVVARYLEAAPAPGGPDALVVHDPEVFYPLGPEISEHWFRAYRTVDPGELIGPRTRVVHWYGSVGTRGLEARLTPDLVRQDAGHRMYCALVAPLL
jgi:hypothetical protein